MCNPILKAVIFDFDDTLVDTQGFFFRHLDNTLVKVFGQDYDRKYIETAKNLYDENIPFVEIFTRTFGERYIEIINRYREDALDAKYEARPGMLAYVRILVNQNTKLIILSNRTRLIIQRLKQAGYDPDWFIVYEAEKRKPHPSAYDRVIKDLENEGIREKDTIIIGNHPDDYDALPETYKTGCTFIALPANNEMKQAFLKIMGKGKQNIHIYDNVIELRNDDGRVY